MSCADGFSSSKHPAGQRGGLRAGARRPASFQPSYQRREPTRKHGSNSGDTRERRGFWPLRLYHFGVLRRALGGGIAYAQNVAEELFDRGAKFIAGDAIYIVMAGRKFDEPLFDSRP